MNYCGGCAERSAPHDNSRHYRTAHDHICQITRRPIPTGHNRTIPNVPRTRRATPHFRTNQNVISENASLSCITAQNRGHREGLCPDISLLYILSVCSTTAQDSTAHYKTAEPFPALSGATTQKIEKHLTRQNRILHDNTSQFNAAQTALQGLFPLPIQLTY